MNKLLIGVHGKPRAGKDTIANYLYMRYNLKRYGAGEPVKKATAAMFAIDIECLYDDKRKDEYNEFWEMTNREMAQFVGKQCSRDIFGEDFWLRHVQKKWNKIRNGVIIPRFGGMAYADIRYENEVHWIKQNGGTVIFVLRPDRPTVSNESHPAEQGLDESLADHVIINDGTIEQLEAKVLEIVEKLVS